MATIKVTLDLTGGIDAEELLGDIRFSDGRSRVVEHDTYVDSWLSSLILALRQLRADNVAEVEILEEPFRLRLEQTSSRLELTWKGTTVEFASYQDLETAVKEAARALHEQLRDHGIEAGEGELQRIISFR